MDEMKIQDLFVGLDVSLSQKVPFSGEQGISSVTADSRNVEEGALFIALQGDTVDGHQFVVDAAELGATVVLCNAGVLASEVLAVLWAKKILVATVADTAEVLTKIAGRFYQNPAENLRLTGITGTNGKTTVAYLTEQVLLRSGRAVGVIGTVNNRYCLPGKEPVILPTRLTTPEPLELQRILRQMADAGVEDVVMEVSSHALAQKRVDGMRFQVAAFTNLSRDHLDYHQDMKQYLQVKCSLFRNYLKKGGVAVLPEGRKKLEAAVGKEAKIYRWGKGENADIQLQQSRPGLEETLLVCRAFSENFRLSTPLVGEYNLENILTAWGICRGLGVENSFIGFALSQAKGAPGRVERIEVESFWPGNKPVVLVDYAHTPDALEKVLETVAALPHHNLCVVFGCGGDRDGGKRPLMGEVAARFADIVIVTDDNPRTENPEKIRAEVLVGVQKNGCAVLQPEWLPKREQGEKGCVVFDDRAAAIYHAVQAMREQDIVVIAGKGHEPYQIIGESRRFFDDRWEAANALFSWSPEQIVRATDGVITGTVRGSVATMLGKVVTDSRIDNPNGIFVALKGENHDGHAYLDAAVAAGNSCLIVEHPDPKLSSEICQIKVDDSLEALGDLALFRRNQLEQYLLDKKRPFQVIGITGSCGKTSVKEMVAAILARLYPPGERYPRKAVLKTYGNFNNLVGLPLTLLRLGVEQRLAIIEMGTNAPGEIRRLAEITRPHIRCITNIHGAHLQGLGSLEGVAEAKGELFASAAEEDFLIVNLDDERVVLQAERCSQQKVSFSLRPEAGATIYAKELQRLVEGYYRFKLCAGDFAFPVRLSVAGEHNVTNALCAAAICFAAGGSPELIAAGLEDFRPVDKRMQIVRAAGGFTLINDCYNANPASMEAGLRVLASFCNGKTLAVLGDMLELGTTAKEAHFLLGKKVSELGIERLAAVGNFAKELRAGAVSGGIAADAVFTFADKAALADWLLQNIQEMNTPEDAVLVKASRGLALETIVQKLL